MESLEIIKKIQALETQGKVWPEILESIDFIKEAIREPLCAVLQSPPVSAPRAKKQAESDEEREKRLTETRDELCGGDWEKLIAHLDEIISRDSTHRMHRANAIRDREFILVAILKQEASQITPPPVPKKEQHSRKEKTETGETPVSD